MYKTALKKSEDELLSIILRLYKICKIFFLSNFPTNSKKTFSTKISFQSLLFLFPLPPKKISISISKETIT